MKKEDAEANPDIIRGALTRIDKIGWQLSHHLPVDLLALSLDEACHLSAALNVWLKFDDDLRRSLFSTGTPCARDWKGWDR